MSYRSDRFNARMRSLDAMAGGRDTSKWSLLSDRGKGVNRMLDAMDGMVGRPLRDRRDEMLFDAEMRLVEANLRHLIPVLLLIVENGGNRETSLARVPRRTYFRHRQLLLEFFACTPAHADI